MIEARVTLARSESAPDVTVGFLPTAPFEDAEEDTLDLPGLNDPERSVPADANASHADVVAGHVLVHAMLARCAGCLPEEIRLRRSPLGRPEVAAPDSALHLQFSVSHADGLALCAVAPGAAIGAGIESVRSLDADPLAIAETACSASELEALRLTSPESRAEHLVALWSVKEALAKAIGPAELPSQEIEIVPREDGTTLIRWGRGASEEQSVWRLISLRPTERHVATIAVPIVSLTRYTD